MKDAQPPGGQTATESAPGSAPGAAPAADPTAGSGTRPRLVRSRRHKVVSGVCGGLGRHYDLDPVVFRVSLVVLSVVSGLGLLFYGFAWLFVPLEGEDENEARRLLSGRVEGTALSALLCALVGSGLFLAAMGRGDDTQVFSLMLAGAVAAAAHWSRQRRRAAAVTEDGDGPADPVAAQVVADAPPETKAPPVPAGPSWWREPLTKDGEPGRPYDTGYLWGPEDEPSRKAYSHGPRAGDVPGGGAGDGTGAARAASAAPPRERSLGGVLFLLALAAAVAGTAIAWPGRPLGTVLAVGFACALGVLGLGTAVSAFYGRVGGGTVFTIVCTGALLAGALVLPKDITTEWSETTWRPVAADRIEERYHLGGGRAVLDLSGVDFAADRTVRTTLDVGVGEARVIVPDGVVVEVTLEAGVGGWRLEGRPGAAGDRDSGHGGGVGMSERRTLPPAVGAGPVGTLVLRVHVGVGEAVVVQRPGPAESPAEESPAEERPAEERPAEERPAEDAR
ncbi:PspC domain-containing protein [Streptomyces sp. TRM 70361]|uniref:PspC domain-containing protein n=1 Tax=Streptomyces sp. TRM 70361 TaxID=3116553 RepID=UPI002E7B044D|nr:PspC domain-containing protein [Streptomyces sp. TRM 70361]MEE1940627.1 PspC domain-containing protein [Streptomyces sp. TRM 70361]